MTITNGYATLAEFKAYATARGQTASTDAGDDTVVEDIIEAVSRDIDKFVGRRFYVNSTDETRYYTPCEPYIVSIDPLSAAPTTVAVDYTGDRATYTTLTVDTDFILLPVNALLDGQPYTKLEIDFDSSAYFPETRNGLKIVGKFGYASVPDNIKNACLIMALDRYQARSGQSSSVVTVSPSGSVRRMNTIPEMVQNLLIHYRNPL